MSRLTVVDIQHKVFKKKLNGVDGAEVDQYLDEIIETLEDEAHARAALEAEIGDLRERISHFKAMEESLHNTLLLAQRTADEVKANAHKEADLIRHEARISIEKEIAQYGERASEARRERERTLEALESVKREFRGLLMTHLSMLDRSDVAAPTGVFAVLPSANSHAPPLALEPTPAQP